MASWREAIAALQVCYRHCHASFPFPGATKGGTLVQRGSVSASGSESPKGLSTSKQSHSRLLLQQIDPTCCSPRNIIFMIGGAPKAHGVSAEKAATCPRTLNSPPETPTMTSPSAN